MTVKEIGYISFIVNKQIYGHKKYKTLGSRPRRRPRPCCQDQDQDQDLFQVFEAPRDQDHVLEDYITAPTISQITWVIYDYTLVHSDTDTTTMANIKLLTVVCACDKNK